ncbi:MAG: trypco2 family protein [Acidobacteriota bacterium]
MRLSRLAAVAALLGPLACATSAPPAAPSPEGAELEAVMEAIQSSLSEAQTQQIAGFPPLKTVTVKLQTEASRSAGGEIALYVFSVGSRYTAETASTLELKMKPPEGRPEKEILSPGDLKQALARAIGLAKVGVARAAQGTPPFRMTDIEIDLKFAVEVTGSAGAKVRLVPLGAEASGKLNRNQVHSITLVFGR